jgi:hypothetical protein
MTMITLRCNEYNVNLHCKEQRVDSTTKVTSIIVNGTLDSTMVVLLNIQSCWATIASPKRFVPDEIEG